MNATARTAWAVGLLEAAGALGDPRAAPVVRRVFESESDPYVLRACAVALARLGDGAIDLLLPLARTPGPRQLAAIEGLAECREPRAAQVLAGLSVGGDEARARLATRSLGLLGSYWVWQAPRYRDDPRREEVRALVARSLVATFASSAGELRAEAEKALLVVAHRDVQPLIDRARAGAPSQKAELDRLARHLARNPLRP
jgi:HEAT repeat protein